MITNFLLNTGTVPMNSCALLVSIAQENAQSMMELAGALGDPGISGLYCPNQTSLQLIPQQIRVPFTAYNGEIPGDVIINVNMRMCVTSLGIYWEGINDLQTMYFRSATLPIAIIQYLAMGGYFTNESDVQMMNLTQKIAPPQRGLFNNH